MSRDLRDAVLLVLVLCAGRDAAAQSPTPLVTDRPSFTEAPVVVGPKVVQFETGVLWGRETVGTSSAKELSAPNLRLRLGMSDRLELRIGTPGLVRDRSARPTSEWRNSATNTDLGVKYQLANQDGLGLDLVVIAEVSVPTGGGTASSNADPKVRFGWGRTLGWASVTGNLNWSSATTPDDERERVLEGSVSVGHALWGSWGAFWEGVVTTVDDSGAPSDWVINAGVTRVVGRNLQLDVHAGRGLNESARDWALGAGVAYRFRR